jgi:maltooligosyltrehalose trehalohydrolase
MLFQGEEWGASTPFLYFTAHADEALGAAVRDGRRKEFAAFGWGPDQIPDPQARETIERSRLRWAELTEVGHADLLWWHRALLALRARHPSLRDGNYRDTRVVVNEEQSQLSIHRGTVVIACNLGRASATMPALGAQRLLLASEPDVVLTGHAVHLPADAIAFLDLA